MGLPDLQSLGGIGPAKSLLKRGPHDDFFCLRFGVWYPSIDCAIRTRYRTCSGCLDCDQGRFNLKRHRDATQGLRVFCLERD
jgi:hypothetical protein